MIQRCRKRNRADQNSNRCDNDDFLRFFGEFIPKRFELGQQFLDSFLYLFQFVYSLFV